MGIFLHIVFIIYGTDASDKFGPCPGADYMSVANLFCPDPYRYRHILQMHSDQRIPDIHPSVGTDMLHRHRTRKRLIRCRGKRSAGLGLGDRIDLLICSQH